MFVVKRSSLPVYTAAVALAWAAAGCSDSSRHDEGPATHADRAPSKTFRSIIPAADLLKHRLDLCEWNLRRYADGCEQNVAHLTFLRSEAARNVESTLQFLEAHNGLSVEHKATLLQAKELLAASVPAASDLRKLAESLVPSN